jgi:hypothetical protein
LVAAQIKFYFERLNSLGDSQNGLREKRSCESALNTMVDYWIKSHDFGESVIAVFIDISKAFDIVNYELLLINFVYIIFLIPVLILSRITKQTE